MTGGQRLICNDLQVGRPGVTPAIEFGRLPLNFWLGPMRLMTLHIPVMIEDFQVVPGQSPAGPTLELRDLPDKVRGVYCRSLPIGNTDALHVPDSVCYVLARYDRRLISLRQTFDDYLAHFSGKTRSTLKRKVRKFAEASDGAMVWQAYRGMDEIAEFHRLAVEISAHTYQEKLFKAGLPDNPRFLSQLHSLAKMDHVRGFILFFHGVPISYLYCPALEARLHYSRLGFRPEYAEHSPGTVLQFLALESLFAERKFDLFDFGEGGQGQHKRLFATDSVSCANVLYLKRTPANVALVACHRTWSRLSARVVLTSDRLGLKRRLRKWARGQTLSPRSPVHATARAPLE